MGLVKSTVERIRSVFLKSSGAEARSLPTRFTDPTLGASSVGWADNAGEGNWLGQYLDQDNDLVSRFLDYENMDDFPEIYCLAGDSLIFTLERGWVEIRELAQSKEEFHVLSYDKNTRSIVPAKSAGAWLSGKVGHGKKLVKVTFDDGRAIKCTDDHLIMRKDEAWVKAGDLVPGERVMPGVLRTRHLTTEESGLYWQIHQPHEDSLKKSSDGKRWMWVHRLVGETCLGAVKGDIVHHINEDKMNNSPGNLSIESASSHASHHIAGIDNSRFFPEWTSERRTELSARMSGNTFRIGEKMPAEARAKIGESQPNRIEISRAQIESALSNGDTLADAARNLGISWSRAKRAAVEHDLVSKDANHRVTRVDYIDEEDVFDIRVPGYLNFVCNGIVVHNSALDIYADDATQPNMFHGRTMWVESRDRIVKDRLNHLLGPKKLNVDQDGWSICRTLAKYGNDYEEILMQEGEGVVGLNFLPPATMRRVEAGKNGLIGFVQDFKGRFDFDLESVRKALISKGSQGEIGQQPDNPTGAEVYEPWEVVHFRLRSKHRRSMYGFSVTEPARWVWRRLLLLEDAVLMYKLTRAPARYAFYVDVGDMPPREAFAWLNKVKTKFKKRRFVNTDSQQIDQRMNPLSYDDDFFIPVRQGRDGTRIEVLSGPDFQSLDDVEMFRGKLFAALKVPRSSLGFNEGGTARAVSAEDIKFARAVLRLQKEMRDGFNHVCRVHLALTGIDPAAVDWEMQTTAPSAIFELANVEVMNAKADLASRLQLFVSNHWILSNIFGMSDEEIEGMVARKTREFLLQGDLDTEVEGKRQAALTANESIGHRGSLLTENRKLDRSNAAMEARLMSGNRDHEKFLGDNFDKIMANDKQLAKKLGEVKHLLGDLKPFMSRGKP